MSTELVLRESSLPLGSLEAYVHWVNQIPMLSQEEEQELAIRFNRDKDLAAAKRLVLAHLRFVVSVARNYAGYGLAQADLIQEGNIGLMKAVKRFDPQIGVRLVTFAVHWIKAEIHEFILRNWRIVKIATTKAQRKVFFNLRRIKKRLGWLTRQEVEEVAKELGVKPEVVEEMESRMDSYEMSFDASESDDEDGKTNFAPADYLVADRRYDPERVTVSNDWSDQGHQQLMLAFEALDERSKEILQRRWLNDNKATLHELAEKYQVSAERIRQLEQNALKKLKTTIQSQIDVFDNHSAWQ